MSSPASSSALISAYLMRSRAAVLDNLFTYTPGGRIDTFAFSSAMPTFNATLYSALLQGGTLSTLGSVYENAATFNESLAQTVWSGAGMSLTPSELTLGGLVDLTT